MNVLLFNLEKCYRCTYLQRRNRDTDVENKLIGTKGRRGWWTRPSHFLFPSLRVSVPEWQRTPRRPFFGRSHKIHSVQFSSVAQLCPTLCDPMNHSTPGLPVHHQLPEFTQTHGHWVHDAIQPSHPLSSPSPPAPNPSQHQSLFQWVSSSYEVAKVLEFQL